MHSNPFDRLQTGSQDPEITDCMRVMRTIIGPRFESAGARYGRIQ